jgi:hypothetical protein
MAQEYVSIPVPLDRVQEVYELLARAAGSGSTPGSTATGSGPGNGLDKWPDELLLRAYRESPPAMKVVFDYLIAHEGQTVTTADLCAAIAKRLDRPQYKRGQLAGVFGAFGRRWKNRYRGGGRSNGQWPFHAEWSAEHGMLICRMSSSVAKVMRRAQ